MPITRAELLDTLDSVHGRTWRTVACIAEDDLEWSMAPGRFTTGDIVRHLATIERWMYAESVQGRPSRYAGCGRELANGLSDVVALYDRLHQESRAIFASLTDADLLARSMTPAGVSITTWKWLRAMFEHEAHHRGQLYLMLGLRGRAVPPIYGLTSEELIVRAAQHT